MIVIVTLQMHEPHISFACFFFVRFLFDKIKNQSSNNKKKCEIEELSTKKIKKIKKYKKRSLSCVVFVAVVIFIF